MKVLVIAALVVAGFVSVEAQQRQGRRQGLQPPQGPDAAQPAEAGVAPAEIQRLFDAYALVQAQEQLSISDDKYSQFLTRFKALQDVRRRSLQEHTRLVLELNRLVNNGQGDEAQLKGRMRALEDADARANADIRQAYEAIDQVLDVRQQAKFRVFEELMERRKLELVTRARQANRPRPQP
ncbi:MAG: hypothetical protein A3H95_18390 [Acidobacteria bacterium RIFCSPLOWO2_02_FULL_64_15]|nr:MAG: hypothetical protein A3H95_18390 [Acidobacteria bacterium RIFCSPLOWO2_02_FULL_64_15]